MRMPRLPRFGLAWPLLGLLAFLMLSSILYSRESLLFCERTLYNEIMDKRSASKTEDPIKFTEVCPEVRERHENATNKWLDVLLALMVQFAHLNRPDS